MRLWLGSRFAGRPGLAVCDANTRRYAAAALPGMPAVVYDAGVTATDTEAQKITGAIAADTPYLVACGSGTVHDLTRYAAHAAGLPFVSYPTAASVDGFVSGIAAMTIGGRKVTYPSTPPVALFADSDIFARTAACGFRVGDIVGNGSLFDWAFLQYRRG